MVPAHRLREAAVVVAAVAASRLLLLVDPTQNSNQRPHVMKHPYRSSINRYWNHPIPTMVVLGSCPSVK
uniref:Putative secreted protein n=1 Tax=Anopheles marajoara TaxID=58244 RepID=A0A2M4CF29_9DIPT